MIAPPKAQSTPKKLVENSAAQDNMTPSVRGYAKTLSMDFEDVFVKADVVYQIMQRICNSRQISSHPLCAHLERSTINLGEIGALRASAISCALALTLALRPFIVLNASLR